MQSILQNNQAKGYTLSGKLRGLLRPLIIRVFAAGTILSTSCTLTFSKLGCAKGGRTLFWNVSAGLSSGHWLHVTGANGAGKTSLLRMLCGLAPAQCGQILWNGQSIHSQPDLYRHNLCYLGHLNALQESMSVQENLSFAARLSHTALSERRCHSVLACFGLLGRAQQLVRHLSQGQKRRVALSRLLLGSAKLWILDEPYSAMDEAGSTLLSGLIIAHLAQGGLAVLTSHQPVVLNGYPAQLLNLTTP